MKGVPLTKWSSGREAQVSTGDDESPCKRSSGREAQVTTKLCRRWSSKKGGYLVVKLSDDKALVKGGTPVKVELWSRFSGDDEALVKMELWSRSSTKLW